MLFDFLVPARVLFGPGSVYRLGEEVRRWGSKALLVTGRKALRESGALERIEVSLHTAGVEWVHWDRVDPEPDLQTVEEARAVAREVSPAVVVGAGGGSVLDVAKAAAGLYYEEGAVREYFGGREITRPGLPWIGVATTAGSGAEVTMNAVLRDAEAGRKGSLRHPGWMAATAIVDPGLTFSMPKDVTARSGMDALTHALEAYTSRWSHPITEALAFEGFVLIARHLYAAYRRGRDREAREKVALGSLMAGMALNNARAGAVHGLAHAVGARYGLPHGLVCGVLLPYVMEFNRPLAEEKYARIAYTLGLVPSGESAEEAARRTVAFAARLRERLGMPEKLGNCGLRAADVDELVEAALPTASMQANPRKATKEDLARILEANL